MQSMVEGATIAMRRPLRLPWTKSGVATSPARGGGTIAGCSL